MANLKDLILVIEDFLERSSTQNILALKDDFEKYNAQDWKKHVTFGADCYSRTPIVQKKSYELLVLCWKPQQGSLIHNHPQQGCLLKVLQGGLTEKQYLNSKDTVEKHHIQGEVSYIDDHLGVHQILNQSQDKAVSLHLYVPGFFQAKVSENIGDFFSL